MELIANFMDKVFVIARNWEIEFFHAAKWRGIFYKQKIKYF